MSKQASIVSIMRKNHSLLSLVWWSRWFPTATSSFMLHKYVIWTVPWPETFQALEIMLKNYLLPFLFISFPRLHKGKNLMAGCMAPTNKPQELS